MGVFVEQFGQVEVNGVSGPGGDVIGDDLGRVDPFPLEEFFGSHGADFCGNRPWGSIPSWSFT